MTKTKDSPTKSVRLAAKLQASATGELPKEIELFHAGSWRTGWHGDFDVTEADLDEAIMHFNNGVYRVQGTEPLAGTLDHLGGDTPAAFRITGLRRDGERLIASVEWTMLGEEKLRRDEYRYISVEFFPSSMPFENPEVEGEMLKNVVTGATLTNDPLLKKLKPVMASARAGTSDKATVKGGDMQLEDLRIKKPEELSDEEKTFLTEHKADLTADELKTFGLEEAPEAPEVPETPETPEQPETPDEPEVQDTKDQPGEPAKVEASAMGALSSAEIKQLKADAQAGREAMQKLQRKEAQEFVAASVAKGRLKSDTSDDAVELLLASSGKQRERLEKFIEALPANSLLDGEKGSGEANEGTSAIDRVFASAQKLVTKGEHKTLGDASRAVLKADAQLAKQFADEQAENK